MFLRGATGWLRDRQRGMGVLPSGSPAATLNGSNVAPALAGDAPAPCVCVVGVRLLLGRLLGRAAGAATQPDARCLLPLKIPPTPTHLPRRLAAGTGR